jgi:hypothetical protein
MEIFVLIVQVVKLVILEVVYHVMKTWLFTIMNVFVTTKILQILMDFVNVIKDTMFFKIQSTYLISLLNALNALLIVWLVFY